MLRPHVSELYLLQTRCPDDFLHRLAPGEAEAYLAAQVADHERTAAQTAGSIAIEHGDPCLMRDFGPAPDPRRPFRLISRLMSEGRLPPAQLKCAHRADLLWVPTSWHADLLSSQGIPRRKLRVLPEYVDTRLFAPASALRPADPPSPGRPFTFLSIFKWEERKGWDALLDAYWTAFRAGGTHPWPVRLRLRTYKPSWEPGPDDIATWIEAHAHKVRAGARVRWVWTGTSVRVWSGTSGHVQASLLLRAPLARCTASVGGRMGLRRVSRPMEGWGRSCRDPALGGVESGKGVAAHALPPPNSPR